MSAAVRCDAAGAPSCCPLLSSPLSLSSSSLLLLPVRLVASRAHAWPSDHRVIARLSPTRRGRGRDRGHSVGRSAGRAPSRTTDTDAPGRCRAARRAAWCTPHRPSARLAAAGPVAGSPHTRRPPSARAEGARQHGSRAGVRAGSDRSLGRSLTRARVARAADSHTLAGRNAPRRGSRWSHERCHADQDGAAAASGRASRGGATSRAAHVRGCRWRQRCRWIRTRLCSRSSRMAWAPS